MSLTSKHLMKITMNNVDKLVDSISNNDLEEPLYVLSNSWFIPFKRWKRYSRVFTSLNEAKQNYNMQMSKLEKLNNIKVNKKSRIRYKDLTPSLSRETAIYIVDIYGK